MNLRAAVALIVSSGLLLCPTFGVAGFAAAGPVAPTNLHLLGGTLTWQDNSSDEDGFTITAELSGGGPSVTRNYRVAANVTSFAVPAEATVDCKPNYVATYLVRAFRGSAVSEPAVTSLLVECSALPAAAAGATATPAAPTASATTGPTQRLPETGGGYAGASNGKLAGFVASVAIALLCAGSMLLRAKTVR